MITNNVLPFARNNQTTSFINIPMFSIGISNTSQTFTKFIGPFPLLARNNQTTSFINITISIEICNTS